MLPQDHKYPLGMEHQDIDLAAIRMKHFIINKLQEARPDLAEQMKKDRRNATNYLGYFLAVYILRAEGKSTPELEKEMMESFNLIR